MKHKTIFSKQLCEISDVLQNQYTGVPDLGVLAGISGMALFQFYYSKYLDVDHNADIGGQMITYCIEKINDGYYNPTFSSGIAGLGWVIQHLKKNDFLDIDCDNLLSPFDEYLHNQMMMDYNNGNYDFLHGALGYAYYFLSRFQNTESINLKRQYQSYILDSIFSLKNLSVSNGNTLKWKSVLDIEKGNKGYNLSLSHGISSILNFNSRLNEIDVFEKPTNELVLGAVNYILSFENRDSDNVSLFPSWIVNGSAPTYKNRIAWCYGDLGIGISLLQAGKSLGDITLQKQALKILNYTTSRTLPIDTLVNDAGICHGSFGIALIYQRLFQKHHNKLFNNCYNFWIEDGIQKAIHQNGYAGYKQWSPRKNDWIPELSLLEGVAGIGLVIIDYLSKRPNSWDECLMIS